MLQNYFIDTILNFYVSPLFLKIISPEHENIMTTKRLPALCQITAISL